MKKKITNAEVESFVTILTAPNSIIKGIRMPHAARQAIRLNLKTLTDRLGVYYEGRKDILDQAVKKGKAEQNKDQYTIAPEYRAEVGKDLQALAMVSNDLEIECFDVDAILQGNDLTLAEEDVLLFFQKGAGD